MVSRGYPTKMTFSDFGSSLSRCSFITCASQPQTFRNDNLGFLPCHISYGVVATDLDGALFKMNAVVSNAYPQNDKGKSVRDIIDRTLSNRVRLRHSDTPLRCGIPAGVSYGTMPQAFRCVPNTKLKYSPPRSDRRCLIFLLI